MKRLIPLWITALGGFVLIVAYFIPVTQGWGELAAIWFNILAAIAFILGGGNLLKIHLKKVSDQGAGWGYSVITVVSFLIMLYVGLVKWGAPPAPNQEFYGETFAALPLESLPDSLTFRIDGSIPERIDGGELHDSVRHQMTSDGNELVFRGWMLGGQRGKLIEYSEDLDWRCQIETLYTSTRPTGVLAGRVAYYQHHQALAFAGHMTEEQKTALLDLGGDDAWVAAVNHLFDASQATTSVSFTDAPPLLGTMPLPGDLTVDTDAKTITVNGPLTPAHRSALNSLFVTAGPLSGEARETLLDGLRNNGPLDASQVAAMAKVLDGSWTVGQVVDTLNAARLPRDVDRSACEMRADREAGVADIPLKTRVGDSATLNQAQVDAVQAFADDPSMGLPALIQRLNDAGDFSGGQESALREFLGAVPTVGERLRTIAITLMKTRDAEGNRVTLTTEQQDYLLGGYRRQMSWERSVGDLFVSAHTIKYRWSGEPRTQGAPFWWLYEYVFKPLQATIFAMLAFYVASAAFRAFRAKNFEAILLLGTAFIILLGRTFAGVYLTGWMPESIAGLKIENLTVYIMQVFNTAGNRAIMIGISLGVAATSLKVLLGVDRSYLGSGED